MTDADLTDLLIVAVADELGKGTKHKDIQDALIEQAADPELIWHAGWFLHQARIAAPLKKTMIRRLQ